MKEGQLLSVSGDVKPGYMELIELFVKVAKLKTNKQTSAALERFGQEMALIGMKLAISAPDDVVNKFILWRGMLLAKDTEKAIEIFGELLLLMRKDIIGETESTKGDMLDMFIEG